MCVVAHRWKLCFQMEQLEQKLASELPSGAVVVACRFPLPNWVPERTAGEGINMVWLYNARRFQPHVTMETWSRKVQRSRT